jgi:hypothetical protein
MAGDIINPVSCLPYDPRFSSSTQPMSGRLEPRHLKASNRAEEVGVVSISINQNNCTACHQFYGLGGLWAPVDQRRFGKGPAYAGAF